MAKQCPNCGKMSSNDKTCGYCGADLATGEMPDKKKGMETGVKIAIALGVIIGLFVIIGIAGSGNKTGTKSTEPPQSQPVGQVAEVKATATPKPVPTAIPVALPTVTKAPPTPSPIPPSPTPKPVGLSRDNPIPVGQVAQIKGSKGTFTVEVTGMNPDAVTVIKGYNMFNPDPKPGYRQILVRAKITNLTKGQDVVKTNDSSFGIVGSSGRVINPMFAVVKEKIEGELFEGGFIEGEIPFEVPEAESDILVIFDDTALGGNHNRYFFGTE